MVSDQDARPHYPGKQFHGNDHGRVSAMLLRRVRDFGKRFDWLSKRKATQADDVALAIHEDILPVRQIAKGSRTGHLRWRPGSLRRKIPRSR